MPRAAVRNTIHDNPLCGLTLPRTEPQERKMFCKEKQDLIRVYASASRKHSALITQLQRRLPTLSKTSYTALYRKAEAWLQEAAVARFALQVHSREHCC
jgi:hypothetical protein